jgi:hypothetical protein
MNPLLHCLYNNEERQSGKLCEKFRSYVLRDNQQMHKLPEMGQILYQLFISHCNPKFTFWREKHGWTGSFTLPLAISGQECTVDMPYGPTNFRSTVIKPYYQDQDDPKEHTEDPADGGSTGDEEGELVTPTTVLNHCVAGEEGRQDQRTSPD